MLLPQCDTYEEIRKEFRWNLPDEFNIASAVCDRYADDQNRVALIFERVSGEVETTSYRQLQSWANRWAKAACEKGPRPKRGHL